MTMSTNPFSQRPQGVGISQSSLSTGTGTPKTVFHVVEAKSFAVEYTDDAGTKHATVAMLIGETWYLPPNGENYAATLRPAAPWLVEQLNARAGSAADPSTPMSVPDNGVDVVG